MLTEGFRDILNVRDLGGYPTNDNRIVKSGCLYRGGSINFFNDEEVEIFKKLGIKAIFDLRSPQEIQLYPNPSFDNIEMIQNSSVVSKVGANIDFSPVGMSKIGAEGHNQLEVLKMYYQDLPFNNKAYLRLLTEIKNGNVPIYFHCASGKDRTGVAAIMILLLLGVKREYVLEDYLKSNLYKRENIEKALAGNEDFYLTHPEAKELKTMFEGVTEKTGNTVLNIIEEKYPHIEDYFIKEYDFTLEEINKVRDMYLINP